jgi:hypothetical protein
MRVMNKVPLEGTSCFSVGSLWGMRPAGLLNSFQSLLFRSLTAHYVSQHGRSEAKHLIRLEEYFGGMPMG